MNRKQICQSAAALLRAQLPTLPQRRAVLGLDGFVDEIVSVVDQRRNAHSYSAVASIAALAGKLRLAAGKSGNYELVVQRTKLGGNGPIMAGALASAGMDITYIGALGEPDIDPVFADLARQARVVSLGAPAHTDALEFADGKLMLGKLQPLGRITWKAVVERVGLDALRGMIERSQLVGFLNWTMLPHMTDIWRQLHEQVLMRLAGADRRLFVDLADPEKRSQRDLQAALRLLSRMQTCIDVILGLNLKEATQVAAALGVKGAGDPGRRFDRLAEAIRARLKLHCVVVHPRHAAAAATESGCAVFDGPFVRSPRIATGAGDHFNAGFCLGQLLGMPLEQSLCTGVASSGYYVRNARSPDGSALAAFIERLPPPQRPPVD